MSGLFPWLWVMLNQRRKINKQCREVSPCRRCESPLMVTDRREPLVTRISDLDENVLRACQRLKQKLGYLRPCFGEGVMPQNKSSRRNLKAGTKGVCLGSKLLACQWPLELRGCKLYHKFCPFCLGGFKDKQQITKLSCSHKFHLDCVLPWLAAHPHCPYCRTPVLVS